MKRVDGHTVRFRVTGYDGTDEVYMKDEASVESSVASPSIGGSTSSPFHSSIATHTIRLRRRGARPRWGSEGRSREADLGRLKRWRAITTA